MAQKKQSEEKWNTTIDDSEHNLKTIRQEIKDLLVNPRYTITYTDYDSSCAGQVTKTVGVAEFVETWEKLQNRPFCTSEDLVKLAIPVINDRFHLPKEVQHQLNNLTNEINKFKRMVEDSHIKRMMETYSKQSSGKS